MINLNIDGKEVHAEEGMSVRRAAKKAGIYIPGLCGHPSLPPGGACRLCIVEIEGKKGFPTACTTPVEDGMIVRTNTQSIQELRRHILELILSEHPYTCLVCDRKERCEEYQGTIRKVGVTTGCEFCPKNGKCELQKVVEHIGIEKVDFPVYYRALPVEKDDPFYERDYNLCVLCGRCVRACQEVRGNGVLAFTYRGSRTLVGTAFGKSHLEAGCEFCGACVDVCPTGALSEKINKWEGSPERSVETICSYCGVGCTIKLNVKANRVIGAISSPEGKVNQGQACVRGRFCVAQMVHSPNRLKNPLVRKNGNLVETTWDEALEIIAKGFSKYKGNQFAFIASPQCTNEDNYIFQKFTRIVMDSDNIVVASEVEDIEKAKIGESNLRGAYNIVGKLGPAEIFRAIDKGTIKALYITHNVHLKDLKKLDFLVVQSVFPTEAIEFAHVVLPAASFAEVEGTFTNLKGESQPLRKAIEPLHNSRADWWVLCEIAKRLNTQGFDFKSPQEISSEISQSAIERIPLHPPLSKGERGGLLHPPLSKGERGGLKVAATPLEIKPSDGFYDYRGGSLINEVKGLKEIVNHWEKNV